MLTILKTKLFNSLPQKILVAVFIVIINFFIFEGLTRIIYCFSPALDSYYENFDLKYHLAEHGPDADKTIIFIGDSLTERSVYPEYIQMLLREQGANTDVLNLATGGATPPIAFQMLKHRVDEDKKPNLVLMNISWRSFHQYWQTELFKGENSNDAMDRSYFGRCLFNKQHGFDRFTCAMSKNYMVVRYPLILNNFLHELPRYLLDTQQKMWSNRDNLTTLFFKRGWVPKQDEYRTRSEVAKYLIAKRNAFIKYDSFFPDIARTGWYTEKYMDTIGEYCQKEKIPLVLVLIPEIKTFSENFYDKSLKITKKQFLKNVISFSNKWHIGFWDLSDAIPDNMMYADTSHLNVLGAIQYSQIISNKLIQNKKMIIESLGEPPRSNNSH